MKTLAEFVKAPENQEIIRNNIISVLRERDEWGKRGLFVRIGENIGFSAAYVGQVLTGKKALTEAFVVMAANYLGVTVHYLRGEDTVVTTRVIRMVPNGVDTLLEVYFEEMRQFGIDRFGLSHEDADKFAEEMKNKLVEITEGK